jgi:hypothetical protein
LFLYHYHQLLQHHHLLLNYKKGKLQLNHQVVLEEDLREVCYLLQLLLQNFVHLQSHRLIKKEHTLHFHLLRHRLMLLNQKLRQCPGYQYFD